MIAAVLGEIISVRKAEPSDLSAVAELTSRRRKMLATWQPEYWSATDDADEQHRAWLDHIIASADRPTLVAVEGDHAIGFCAGTEQDGPLGRQLFLDDVCVADGRWEDAGSLLLDSVHARPVVVNVPCPDIELAITSIRAGFELVGHYRLRRLREPTVPRQHTQAPPIVNTEPAVHTFGAIDLHALGTLAVGDADGSYVVGSASLRPPPIYDPGGTTCVIDRVGGPAGAELLNDACAVASMRGDVQVVVAHSAADTGLDDKLASEGWPEPFVDVYVLA